ncbi:oligogalacturonate lyase family protein [Alicyclobacillus fodiniaquatilis]|uniref:Oligogalacturonate lyase family protein n=1 Tax=Alicyclobacillus fodiniaquatilis TaxID=1661150 RepID=A0ABW4JEB6_9BACL
MTTGKGYIWPTEWTEFRDPFSGVHIRQLTNYRAHSAHLYFTENGWYDENRRLLFISDRENRTNLFSLCMSTGEITQLTDLDEKITNINPCLNPEGTKAYFSTGEKVYAVDLYSLQLDKLYEETSTFRVGQLSCTADGQFLITALSENMSHRFRVDLGNGYVGHREIMEAKPHSKIIKIPTNGGEPEVVFEEQNWIGHINTSPTQSHLITFCHEGPWDLVDHRIWGFDLNTKDVWKIRPRIEAHEKVGHEYWHADGIHLGYHGFRENGIGFFGKTRYDNTEQEEIEFPFRNWHAQSDGFTQVVVDGRTPSDSIIYWKREHGSFSHAKLLCQHRCSFHSQKVHAHPRFSPDGTQLLFTSDKNGYGNLYLVDIPKDVDSLPDYKV